MKADHPYLSMAIDKTFDKGVDHLKTRGNNASGRAGNMAGNLFKNKRSFRFNQVLKKRYKSKSNV